MSTELSNCEQAHSEQAQMAARLQLKMVNGKRLT